MHKKYTSCSPRAGPPQVSCGTLRNQPVPSGAFCPKSEFTGKAIKPPGQNVSRPDRGSTGLWIDRKYCGPIANIGTFLLSASSPLNSLLKFPCTRFQSLYRGRARRWDHVIRRKMDEKGYPNVPQDPCPSTKRLRPWRLVLECHSEQCVGTRLALRTGYLALRRMRIDCEFECEHVLPDLRGILVTADLANFGTSTDRAKMRR